MKQKLLSALLILFVILGIFLCVYYAKIYAADPTYPMQLALSVICAAESVVTSVSLYIRLKNKKTKFAKIINGASFLLCLQVGLFAFMWFTYFLGIAVDSIS